MAPSFFFLFPIIVSCMAILARANVKFARFSASEQLKMLSKDTHLLSPDLQGAKPNAPVWFATALSGPGDQNCSFDRPPVAYFAILANTCYQSHGDNGQNSTSYSLVPARDKNPAYVTQKIYGSTNCTGWSTSAAAALIGCNDNGDTTSAAVAVGKKIPWPSSIKGALYTVFDSPSTCSKGSSPTAFYIQPSINPYADRVCYDDDSIQNDGTKSHSWGCGDGKLTINGYNNTRCVGTNSTTATFGFSDACPMFFDTGIFGGYAAMSCYHGASKKPAVKAASLSSVRI